MERQARYQQLKKWQVPPKKDLFMDFVAHATHVDPSQRWSAAQLLSHPFLNGLDSTYESISIPNVAEMDYCLGLKHVQSTQEELENVFRCMLKWSGERNHPLWICRNTMNLVRAFLSRLTVATTHKISSIVLAAHWISIKMDGRFNKSSQDMANVVKNIVGAKEIVDSERFMVQLLDGHLLYPPHHLGQKYLGSANIANVLQDDSAVEQLFS